MKIISQGHNSTYGSGGWRHHAEVALQIDSGEMQYVFGTDGSMELWSVFRISGLSWYLEGDSWCEEDPYVTSVCDFDSLEQAKKDAVYGEYFRLVKELLQKEKASF